MALGVIVILIFIWWLISPSGDSKPVVVSTPTPDSTGTASPSASANSDCSDSDISVSTEMAKSSYPVGAPIVFDMLISNKGSQACNRNVGPKINTFKVTSGGQPAWSSDDCSPTGSDQIVAIPAGGAFKVQATWDQKISKPKCPKPQPAAQPGTYQVVGINAVGAQPAESRPRVFVIT